MTGWDRIGLERLPRDRIGGEGLVGARKGGDRHDMASQDRVRTG